MFGESYWQFSNKGFTKIRELAELAFPDRLTGLKIQMSTNPGIPVYDNPSEVCCTVVQKYYVGAWRSLV